jgi:hypothetical protein
MRTKKTSRVKRSLLRDGYPEKGVRGLHVGEPRRLTCVPACLYSGVQPIRRMDACLSDHRLRPPAQMSGIFVCLCLAN